MVGRESGFVAGYKDFVLFHVAGLEFTWLNLKLATFNL
jgi:hypothetical protein